eukprot:3941307-Prymnesium_polylepis.1
MSNERLAPYFSGGNDPLAARSQALSIRAAAAHAVLTRLALTMSVSLSSCEQIRTSISPSRSRRGWAAAALAAAPLPRVNTIDATLTKMHEWLV